VAVETSKSLSRVIRSNALTMGSDRRFFHRCRKEEFFMDWDTVRTIAEFVAAKPETIVEPVSATASN